MPTYVLTNTETKETYEDLRTILTALMGVAWETQEDIEYVNALTLIVNKYERENDEKKVTA